MQRSYNQIDNNEVVTEEVAAVVENNTGIEIEPLFEERVDFDTFSKSDFRVVKVKIVRQYLRVRNFLDLQNFTCNRKSYTTFYDGNRFMWYASFCNSQCKWRRKTESGNVR